MKYPIVIEWGDDATAHGIHIPDLNASTSGDTIEKAFEAAIEAADLELQNIASQGKNIPTPSPIETLRFKKEFRDMGWGFIDVDITPFQGKTEKINVTIPQRIIAAIDNYVSRFNLKSRSSFLSEAALEKIKSPSLSSSIKVIQINKKTRRVVFGPALKYFDLDYSLPFSKLRPLLEVAISSAIELDPQFSHLADKDVRVHEGSHHLDIIEDGVGSLELLIITDEESY
ncbi:hypothetical protein CUZ56_00755 [Saezia sanguinis]|uniref:HicB-like antitoxin of toxin-antitoxin system domain-containing protein n=1 Tax=Saezia sanguinis TaxID=1965230 RepID=A0A433SHN2_9BURK|nr:type II toxin-antitoxin system HicB family antitoxin [Saezia sanguinis]RUS68267.1 hypothetical protein CUZ56_00755 [Saezia sanguinis]